ncbi:MAG: glycogen-binding domain-containing protein, partial [Balneolaceae bacterium]
SGYTSNTYLNPFLSEWDRTADVGYLMISPMGQLGVSSDRFSSDLTAGFVYEPFFDDRDAWSGVFALMGSRYKVANRISVGVEGGVSRFSTFLDRNLYWVQPVLSWSPSPFTQLRFKAGSSFRKLSGSEMEEEQNTLRFDSYTVELETWPNFQWQFRSSLFGNLDDPAANIGLRASADYRATRSLQFSLNGGLERYQFQIITENGGGGGPGPPFGIPPGGGTQILDEADRIVRAGAGASYQINTNVAVSLQGDYLNYHSSATGESIGDFHFSAGVRLSIFPKMGRRGKANVQWRQNDSQTVILNLKHSGDGQLYILGDFNEWKHPGVPLSRQSGNRYAARLSLSPGVYEYKILLIVGSEETWLDFFNDIFTVPDGFGGENGLIFID